MNSTNQRDPTDAAEHDLAPVPGAGSPTGTVVPAIPPPATATLDYRAAAKDKPAPTDSETLKNWHMPLWLLAGGVVVQALAALIREGMVDAALDVALNVVVGTGLMFVAVLLVSRLRQIDFGPYRVALLKLAAVWVAPGAIVTLLTPVLNVVPFGGLIGLGIGFVLYFALLGALFDLEESDTWYCLSIIFLVYLSMYFLSLWVLHR